MCGSLDLESQCWKKKNKEKRNGFQMIYLKNMSLVAWFRKILETVCKGARGLANDEQNECSKILCMCFVWVCPNYTDPMHIASQFFEKQRGLPRGFVCRRINHALIGYSVPVTHRWLQVNSPHLSVFCSSLTFPFSMQSNILIIIIIMKLNNESASPRNELRAL